MSVDSAGLLGPGRCAEAISHSEEETNLPHLAVAAALLFCAALAPRSSGLPRSGRPHQGHGYAGAAFQRRSRQIWEFAEVGYKEVKSCALLQQEMKEQGFPWRRISPRSRRPGWPMGLRQTGHRHHGRIRRPAGLSQDMVPEKKPIVVNGPGHACGHNLLGTASAFAAVAVKNYMAQHNCRARWYFTRRRRKRAAAARSS